MKIPVPEQLKKLAAALGTPLYAVGGYVRNYLYREYVSEDIDLAAGIGEEPFSAAAKECGFAVKGLYVKTRTAVIECGGVRCEYTAFRKDRYPEGGEHRPLSTEPAFSPEEDAPRRDFACNAVYYDISGDKIIDPLGGKEDIARRTLRAADAERVFSSDGLRLMRLARFAGELGFEPEENTVFAARKNAALIKDVAPERIFSELKRILSADCKYPFSPKDGHYRGLKILDKTRVLDYIMPELTLGRGMPQRADFHKYDVLEHTLKTVLYSPLSVRLAALLHDVGKPASMLETGKFSGHDAVGEKLAKKILARLKADKKTASETAFLAGAHMKDLNGDMRESKVRLFIAENYGRTEDLLQLKQADFSAGKDDLSEAPIVKKWRAIMRKMEREGAPFTRKKLNITAADLIQTGFSGKGVGDELDRLFKLSAAGEIKNAREVLMRQAERDFERNDGKTI